MLGASTPASKYAGFSKICLIEKTVKMDRKSQVSNYLNDTSFLADYIAWCIYKAKRKRRGTTRRV